MTYVKSFFYNFLAVFLANQLIPGIEVLNPTKLPYVGSDLVFAVVLGAMQASIYPFFKLIFRRVERVRQALASFVFSFAAYAILKFIPLGIDIKSAEGYLFASTSVALVGFLTNYFVMKKINSRFHSSISSSDDLST